MLLAEFLGGGRVGAGLVGTGEDGGSRSSSVEFPGRFDGVATADCLDGQSSSISLLLTNEFERGCEGETVTELDSSG